jgi:hypothetical protein
MSAALSIGVGILIVSVLTYTVATVLIVQLAAALIRAGYTGRNVRKNVAIMLVVVLITWAAHLTQIALWALAFFMIGESSTFEAAFYFSAENYTALGYGDITLSEKWRLLGPLEGINGLLLFGLSTALMFAIMSRLITSRLRHRLRDAGATASTGKLAPADDKRG